MWLETPSLPPGPTSTKLHSGPAQTHGVTMWAEHHAVLKPSHGAYPFGGLGHLHPTSCSQQDLSVPRQMYHIRLKNQSTTITLM